MKIKKFFAPTMQEVLSQIKKELGPDAVILSSKNSGRETKKNSRGKKCFVEVTAATDYEGNVGGQNKSQKNEIRSSLMDEMLEVKKMVQADHSLLLASVDGMREISLSLLKREDQFDGREIHSNLLKLYQTMVNAGMSEEFSSQLIKSVNESIFVSEAQDYDKTKELVSTVLLQLLGRRAGKMDNHRTIIAFIGPTGAGKTTTLAKLAAIHTLKEKKKVGIITLDTFRIAAEEQLKTYARIIGSPVIVVTKRDQLAKALDSYKDYDEVLIDTAGRSHKNQVQMDELASFLDSSCPLEKHLVLSSTMDQTMIKDVIRSYSSLTLDSLLFTKIDEGRSFGHIITSSVSSNLPVSYITTGQNVPEDIECSPNKRIVELCLH